MQPVDGTPGEVPGALWVPANPSNYRERPQHRKKAYDLIVIHITSGRADPYGPARMWQRPKHGSSAHFVVGQDGRLLQCVPLRYAAFHAHAANEHSVGIEHCAREPRELGKDDPGMPPTPQLYASSAALVAYLLKAAGLPVAHHVTIMGHAEADKRTTHRGCPDKAPWDWELYLAMVQNSYEAIGGVDAA